MSVLLFLKDIWTTFNVGKFFLTYSAIALPQKNINGLSLLFLGELRTDSMKLFTWLFSMVVVIGRVYLSKTTFVKNRIPMPKMAEIIPDKRGKPNIELWFPTKKQSIP